MADNVAITSGSGTSVATDQVGSDHYQRVKITDGTADSSTHLAVVAEDTAHTTGDTGLMFLAVRKDSAVALATSDGDYIPLIVDSTGRLHITNADLATIAAAVDTQMQVDVVAALPAGDNNIGNVDIVSGTITAVTDITNTVTVTGDAAGSLTVDNAQLSVVGGGTEAAALRVTIANDSTGVLTVDGTVAVTNADMTTVAGAVSATHMQSDVLTMPGTAAEGAALPALMVVAAGDDGTDTHPLQLDSNGYLKAVLQTSADVDIGAVDVTAIAAGENLIGKVGASDIVVTIAPTMAAEAHSAGDLLFDSTEVANAVRANASTAIVESITVVDKGDQGAEINLIFANAATDFGAPGGVPDPDDTDALTVLGIVNVATTDYVDLGAFQVATVNNIGMLIKAGAATTSVYLAGIAVGTPTPASTSDLQISIGFLRS